MQLLIALAVVVSLALIASSRFFWSLRRYPVGAVLITGGWMMVGLGMLLSLPGYGLVDHEQIISLRPLIDFCLAWVGLLVGLQLRKDLPTLIPGVIFRITFIDALVTVVCVAGGCFAVWHRYELLPKFGESSAAIEPRNYMIFWAILLGLIAVGWSPEMRSLTRQGGSRDVRGKLLRGVSGLSAIVMLLGFGLFSMLFEPDHLVISFYHFGLGVGVSILIALVAGMICFMLIDLAAKTESQFLVILLGLISLVAGAAVALSDSPLFAGLLTGVVLVNMPGKSLAPLQKVIVESEQHMGMALMLVAGLLADPTMPTWGWMLVALILGVRLIVKTVLDRTTICKLIPKESNGELRFAPIRQNPLAIAVVCGLVLEQWPDSRVFLMIVIIVGFIGELLPQLVRYRSHRNTTASNNRGVSS